KPGVVQVLQRGRIFHAGVAAITFRDRGGEIAGRVVELAVVHGLVIILGQVQNELLREIFAAFGELRDDVVVQYVYIGPAVAPRARQGAGEEYIPGNIRLALLR